MSNNLDKKIMLKSFKRIAEIAKEKNIRFEILIFGGAAMVLSLESRNTTQDIDVKVTGDKNELFSISLDVGEEFGFDPGWLNYAVTMFASKHKEEASILFSSDNFTVMVASPRYILAMKVLALRVNYSHDIEDIKFLIKYLTISNMNDLLKIVNEFYPNKIISVEKLNILKLLFCEN